MAIVSDKALTKALLRRQQLAPAPLELQLRADFLKQNAFVEDTSRYIDAQCSRRAGKTNGLGLRYFKTMDRHPRSQCLYLSLTQDSAREIMWPILQEIDDKYKIGCKFLPSNLTVTHPNKATLKLMGADLKDFIKRLKGRKYPGVAIDEAQDFGTHLQSLVDDVLTPCIADYSDGWLALTGTPGPVPQGYFFDITRNKKYGFSHHEWTLFENPHMPDPKRFVADLKAKREWEDNNPTLLREWHNQWVLDVQSLWIRYNAGNNHYQELPVSSGEKYTYVLGIDIGFRDADAIAVIGWNDKSQNIYLVEEVVTEKQGLTELVDQINSLRARYDVCKMVIDEGGLGKKLAEEVRRRHHIPVQPADKARKQENVEFLNDYMRMGKFKAKSASRFAQDSYLIQIDWDHSTPGKIVIKKKPHSDIIDAVLYAFKESPAYSYQAEKLGPRWGTKEWAEAQQNEMFEAELKGLQEEADYNRRLNGDIYT